MYKVFIRNKNSTKELYSPYTEETTEATEDGVETKVTKIYETADLMELAEKYKTLLSDFTTEQIKLVEELDVSIVIDVLDN